MGDPESQRKIDLRMGRDRGERGGPWSSRGRGEEKDRCPLSLLSICSPCFWPAQPVSQRVLGGVMLGLLFPSCPGSRGPKATNRPRVLCREMYVGQVSPKRHGENQNLTYLQTLSTRRASKASPPSSSISIPLSITLGAGKSFSSSNLCPSSCSLGEILGATQAQRC